MRTPFLLNKFSSRILDNKNKGIIKILNQESDFVVSIEIFVYFGKNKNIKGINQFIKGVTNFKSKTENINVTIKIKEIMMKLKRLIMTTLLVVMTLFGASPVCAQNQADTPAEDPFYRTVFESGKEGNSIYRIPSITVARSGKILAFSETRNDPKYDAAGNDIVIKTSEDNGQSWSKLRVICSDKENALMNPTVTVDRTTGRIILFYVRYPVGLHEGQCEKGYEGDKVLRTYKIFSDDEGVSWSYPKDITVQVKAPETRTYVPGPGRGIQLKNGKYKNRLVVPFNTTDTWQNYLVYSDDGGKNWQRAEGRTGYGLNEVQVVELSDGSIMANARSHRWKGHKSRPKNWDPWNWSRSTRQRGTAITKDSGKTWSPVKDEENLIDPTCMGSIIRIDNPHGKQKSCLLFSNPANDIIPTGPGRKIPKRVNGTVRVSYDDGKSWKYSKNIYGDEKTHFAYSVLVHLKNGNIGCLFESEGKIIFTSFSFSWLTDGK